MTPLSASSNPFLSAACAIFPVIANSFPNIFPELLQIWLFPHFPCPILLRIQKAAGKVPLLPDQAPLRKLFKPANFFYVPVRCIHNAFIRDPGNHAVPDRAGVFHRLSLYLGL